ncbi:SIMPL domain-containing protein [Phocaeicola coprocola]|uniref:SIMPL domain-containing protein n=1 Tax=Phocaeicola coprocola TaxID=310298 RepID=UPI003A9547B4
MKKYGLIFIMSLLVCVTMKAQECERYIEVTGTSEMEVVPDEIHYLIEIQEYFEEEFDGVSKSEQYKTKVPITRIEQELMQAIHDAGIPDSAVRVQEYGNNWRHQGHDFLISKQLDITLQDFKQIDRIVQKLNTRGIHSMRIGKLDNKDILTYHQKAKIEALKAAQRKAAYLVEALDKKLGPVMHIVENETDNSIPFTQSNVLSSYAVSFNNFRIIKKNVSIRPRACFFPLFSFLPLWLHYNLNPLCVQY